MACHACHIFHHTDTGGNPCRQLAMNTVTGNGVGAHQESDGCKSFSRQGVMALLCWVSSVCNSLYSANAVAVSPFPGQTARNCKETVK